MARTRVGLGKPLPKAKPKPDRPNRTEVLAVLNLHPAVAALPQDFTEEQKVWWNKYIGKKFRGKVAKRGKKWDNARTWTYNKFIGDFCDDFYPRLSEDERKQYHIIIGPKVYSYLTNHSSRGSSGITIKTKPMKQRVYAQDIWRRQNPEAFDKAWEEHKSKNPGAVLNIGTRRALTGTFFRDLPQEEQDKYQKMAKEELKTIQSLQRLQGDAKHRYAANYIRQMAVSSAQAELCAGIRTSTVILAEDENGQFKITLLMSDGLEDFRKVPAVAQHVHALKKWVEDQAGKKVHVETPLVTVYPDYANEMYPLVPDITGMRLNELQKTCRTYVSKVYSFQGGYAKVPWELIASSIDEWIEPNRRPAGVPFKDPSGMTLPIVLVWINYFHEGQDGTIAAGKRFQFCKVIAGPSPIPESQSQELSRRQEFFTQHNRELWVFVFKATVSKCHAPDGMQYSEHSLAYARFITNHQVPADQEDPPEWLELPPGDPANPTAVIEGEEKALILDWATQLPEAQRELVVELVDAVNEHQTHIPASATDGLWTDNSVVPAILPPSLPAFTNALPLFTRFWGPVGYYLASGKAPLASTWGYFRLWQDDMLTSYILLHQPSGTLLGGHTGCVWVVRALILLVFNFAAVLGDLKPPVPPPSADYDLSCLPTNELEHLLGWCRIWIEKICASTEILKQTSTDRRNRCLPSPEPSEPSEPVVAAGPAQAAAGAAHRRKKRKGKGKGKGKQSRASSEDDSDDAAMPLADSDESDDPGPELNYDELDRNGDNESDDDDDGLGGPSTGWGGFGALNAGSDSEDEDAPVTPKRHSQKPAPSGTSSASGSSKLPRPVDDSGTDNLFPDFPSALLDKHVFGLFYTLPPVSKQQLPTTYHDIHAGLQSALKTISETLTEWKTLAADNPILRPEDHKAAERVASKLPAQWQPLLHFLAARRLAWKRAKDMAPAVLEFAPRLILAAREAFRLDPAIERYCQDTAAAEESEEESLDALEKLQTKAMMGTAELCWCYKELQAFDKLSTQWIHETGDNWLHDTLTHDVPTLLALARPLVKWADAAQELDKKLRERRRPIWAPTKRPFPKGHATSSLWYWFGSPHPEELPNGLRECFASAINAYRNGSMRDDSEQPGLGHSASSRAVFEGPVSDQLDLQPDMPGEQANQQGEAENSVPLEEFALNFVQQMVNIPELAKDIAGAGESPSPSSGATAEEPSGPASAAPTPSSPKLPAVERPESNTPSRATPTAVAPQAAPSNVATASVLPVLTAQATVSQTATPMHTAASKLPSPQKPPSKTAAQLAPISMGPGESELPRSSMNQPPASGHATPADASSAAVQQEGVPTAESPTLTTLETSNPDSASGNPPTADNNDVVPPLVTVKKPRVTETSGHPPAPANIASGRATRSSYAAASAQAENNTKKTRASKKRAGETANDDTPKTRSKRGKSGGK